MMVLSLARHFPPRAVARSGHEQAGTPHALLRDRIDLNGKSG